MFDWLRKRPLKTKLTYEELMRRALWLETQRQDLILKRDALLHKDFVKDYRERAKQKKRSYVV